MMRKILLALALASIASPVWAVCPTPLTGKDGAGNPQNFGVTVDGSGNCYGNVGIVDGTNAANKATVTASGAVKTDASATTQPVSGTLAATQSGTWTVQPGNTANTTAWKVDGSAVTQPVSSATLSTAANQATAITALNSIATNTAAAIPAGTNVIGFVTPDPCSQLAKTNVPISQTASAQLLAGTSAKKTYICSLSVIGADAENLSLVEGTGSVCATGIAAVLGGTTAAAGYNLAANGGLTLGNGLGAVAIASNANADNVCLLQSGSGRVAGNLTYVQQ